MADARLGESEHSYALWRTIGGTLAASGILASGAALVAIMAAVMLATVPQLLFPHAANS